MKLQTRLDHIQTKLQPVKDGVMIYCVETGKASKPGWKPGMPWNGPVIIDDIPRAINKNEPISNE